MNNICKCVRTHIYIYTYVDPVDPFSLVMHQPVDLTSRVLRADRLTRDRRLLIDDRLTHAPL
jgi:hypothetical protein